jgi:hypothetical protein
VFALALACYTANGKTIPSGDTLPARYLPFSILQHGDLDLDEFPFLQRGDPYFLRYTHGHWVSFYPVGAALLATPFYVPAVLAGAQPGEQRSERLEKVAAASIVALSVAVVYVTLDLLVDRRATAWITLAYALGTSSFSVSSQGLWQHGPAQLCLALAALLLVAGRMGRSWAVVAAGFPLAFAVVCRPTDVALALPFAIYVLVRHPREFLPFAIAGFAPMLFQIGYNVVYWHDPFWVQFPFGDRRWRGAPTQVLAGLLFSPSRGLFVYSPVLLFSLCGIVRSLRPGGDPLVRAIGASVVLLLALMSKWSVWWGGACYGPRMLADVTPLLAVATAPCADLLRSRPGRFLFAVTLAWSVTAHGLGAYWEDGSWNWRLESRQRAAALWSWSDNQLANSLRDAAAALRHAWRGD